jgi:ABC-type glycerol-3-phosphate transport system substrate-binding protein
VANDPAGMWRSRGVRRRAAIARALAAGALPAACAAPGGSATESAGAAAAPVGVTLLARTSEAESFTRRAAQLQERYPRIRRFGGELLSADGKRCLADTPQALAAMEWHWDLWHRRRLMNPEPSTGPDFGGGKNAMAGSEQGGNRAAYHNAVKGAFRWSLVQMPKGPTGKLGADLSLDPMSLNARTAVVDQAWTVLQWFTDRETGVALTQQTASSASTTPGMRHDVYCDERVLTDPNATREVMERFCKAMDAATSNTYIFPGNFRVTELDEVVIRHLNAFRDNTAAPSAATMRAFTAELQAVLDLPRGI